MEGNKDDAAKCLRIAKDALQSGDRARALKFLTKARRLDPSLPIDDLLSAASSARGDDSSAAPQEVSSSSSTASSSATRSRPRARVSPSDGATGSNYTEEQIEMVREVKRKQKDYYSILGLEKSCTVEDVRRAYRKLSLKVHPDKNKAPGAEDAFKSVSKAFQCLSNEETRKRYDLVGSDEPVAHRRSSQSRHDGFYDGEFDADEIFRNFFYGGMAPGRTTSFGTFHFRTGGMNRAPRTHESGNNSLRLLVQILPVIILILFSFVPSSEPVYMLSRGYPYEHKMQTGRGVAYYVKGGRYEEEYPYGSQKRVELERRIEREYVGVVSQNCRLELQRKQWGFSYQTPHCDLLTKYEQAASPAAA